MTSRGLAAVTGAGRGIGLAVTAELARRGFDVLALVRQQRAAEDVLRACKSLPGKVTTQTVDVATPGDFQFPKELQVLVNNAGIRLASLSAEHTPLADWRQTMEVNFFGTLEMTQRAIPILRARGGGVICNITSGSLLMPFPFLAPYRAAKSAVHAMNESLRMELQPQGIRMVEIMAGNTVSGLSKDSISQHKAAAADYDLYAPMAATLLKAMGQFAQPTPAEQAAVRIVDAIFDDDGPMCYGTDENSSAALEAWRQESDETIFKRVMQPYQQDHHVK